MSLDELAVAAGQGDPAARRQLGAQLPGILAPYFRGRFDEQELEDLTQLTITVIFTELHKYENRGPGSFRAWIGRIAHYRRLQFARQQNREQRAIPLDDLLPAPQVGPREWLHWHERLEAARDALSRVQPLFREAFEHLFAGGDPEILAKKYGVKPHTIETRASRALEQVRAELRARYHSSGRFCVTPSSK
jgi:RNA polymerase sigma factor (sigma-70 family)